MTVEGTAVVMRMHFLKEFPADLATTFAIDLPFLFILSLSAFLRAVYLVLRFLFESFPAHWALRVNGTFLFRRSIKVVRSSVAWERTVILVFLEALKELSALPVLALNKSFLVLRRGHQEASLARHAPHFRTGFLIAGSQGLIAIWAIDMHALLNQTPVPR